MPNKFVFDTDNIEIVSTFDSDPIEEFGCIVDHIFMGQSRVVNLPVATENQHFREGVVLLREGSNQLDSRLVRMIADAETKMLRVEVMTGRPAFHALQEIDAKSSHLAVPLREA